MIFWKQEARTVQEVGHNLSSAKNLSVSGSAFPSKLFCILHEIFPRFSEYLTRTQISLIVLIVSHNILQHAVRSLTANLRQWPWQWVTRALVCSTKSLVATTDFVPIILLAPLYLCPLQCWRLSLNLNKIFFIAFTTVTLFMSRRSQANLPLLLNYHLLYECKRKTVRYWWC